MVLGSPEPGSECSGLEGRKRNAEFREVSDGELKKRNKSDIKRDKTELPKGATEEMFVDAVIYQMKTPAGEELPLPEGGIEKLVTVSSLRWLGLLFLAKVVTATSFPFKSPKQTTVICSSSAASTRALLRASTAVQAYPAASFS